MQFSNFFLGARIVVQQALARLRGSEHVVVVIARIHLNLAVVDVGNVRADLIQEVTIVRDDNHGGIALVERIFQPANRVDVQVVGWLIQQQHVRIGEQRLRQQHAQLPARRDFAHRAGMLLDRNAHAEQQGAGARFGGVAVVLGHFAFQFGRAHVIVFGRLGIGVDRVALMDRIPQLAVALQHHINHALVFIAKLILLELTQAHAGVEADIAGGGFEIAAQNFHESGFAAAVGANQTVAVAIAKLNRNLFKQRFRAKLHRDTGSTDHGLFFDPL